MIEAGQIYQSADPREGIRILVEAYQPGSSHAYVVDAYTGKRPRSINVKFLHASATTKTGARRRTGYILQPGGTA